MNELQAKLLVGVLGAAFFMSYALPKLDEMKENYDQVVKMVGQTQPPQPEAKR